MSNAMVNACPMPTFGGKRIEDVARFSGPMEIDPRLKEIIATATPRLAPPYSSFFGDSRTKNNLFREFPDKLRQAEEVTNAISPVAIAILLAKIQCRNVRNPDVIIQRVISNVQKEAPFPITTVPKPSLAQLALKDDQEVWTEMSSLIETQTAVGVTSFFKSIELLGIKEWIGKAVNVGCGVWQYHDYRWIVAEQEGETRWGNTTRETDITRSLRQELHLHELRNANLRPLTAATDLPPHVKNIVEKMPNVLRPQLMILDGEEMFRRVLEREVISETRTEVTQFVSNHDPCLCLGEHVLISW